MISINSQQYPSKIQVKTRPQSQMYKNPSQLHQQQHLNCFQQYKIAQQPPIASVQYVMNPSSNQLLFKNNGPIQQVQLRQYKVYQPDQYVKQSGNAIQKITYNDDDMIQPKKYTPNKYNLNEQLSFEVKALYKKGKLPQTRPQYLPGIVSLKAQDQNIFQKQESQRVGVDLICLIDISGSMIGVKIEMVKASLIVLLQFLGDNDRLQLITFDNDAHRLTPLKTVTNQNKSYFTQIIKQIQADGGNRISEATKMTFYQLKGRKYINNVTSVFLLSDGVDVTYPEVKKQIKTVNEVFTLHTFGFGEDHDAQMMTQLCNLKSGSFYFVQDVTLLDEFFADALGGLISVVGEQLEITLSSSAPPPYQDIQISKTYGNMWQKKGNQYYITQPQIASGSRKDYVFELALPKFEGKIEDNHRNVKVIEAVLKIKDPINGAIITKQTSLTLTFFNQDEQINQNESDIDVYAQYYRVKGTEVIDDARKACEQNKNEDAQKLIDNMLIQIQKNQNVAAQCTGIIQDLQQAKQASSRNTYNLFGQKQMCQMVSNNYQQGGVNSLFSATGAQLQQVQPAAYSNACQQQMMFQVQASKPNYKPS
ncbi:unnamed protein product (macronuclear) [Paramecium tetraurelia]|uniref:VWFA domain-containing protein n=1 Tax=Paramecium tetraurelia TaxID=5888 RepID=A0C052_PARTE|nr:uncharacterized protein GSPATT00006022001 [Paramecium tetraurelia]CAK64169.1 unnamed protein product [Paramecium tetraurelia]|eukprot:XP_001431567.1 hypothetical protein (macronuclear) [Paramecium tetraurelia strain d4-2]